GQRNDFWTGPLELTGLSRLFPPSEPLHHARWSPCATQEELMREFPPYNMECEGLPVKNCWARLPGTKKGPRGGQNPKPSPGPNRSAMTTRALLCCNA